MVMEKSWNMKICPKVMEFCYQSSNFVISHQIFTNFAPELHQICTFFATTKKLSINVESLHFQTISAKHRKCKIEKRDSHGKIFCQVCGNPDAVSSYKLVSVNFVSRMPPSQCRGWCQMTTQRQTKNPIKTLSRVHLQVKRYKINFIPTQQQHQGCWAL